MKGNKINILVSCEHCKMAVHHSSLSLSVCQYLHILESVTVFESTEDNGGPKCIFLYNKLILFHLIGFESSVLKDHYTNFSGNQRQ